MIDSEELSASRGWAQASLRIAGEDLGADAIGEMLGRRPSTARESEGAPSFTVWVLESGLDPSAPIEDHLYILMEGLRDRHDALRVLAEKANVEVWLSFSPDTYAHRSAIFGHRVLAELGDLGIDLVLDPYPPGRGRARHT
ncbi:MAG TPA: DUF4279 domain-containing protein [Microthrixaceae bacterium]|nr:DUF4279 domain-containing protein [Microthrixaceae bacterium]